MRGRPPKPLVLVVLDGWGISDRVEGNAVALARKPTVEYLLNTYPSCRLEASGESVGLMPGQMGDSNVGHLNLGAGRIVYQDVVRISRSIRQGTFFENPVLTRAIEGAKARGGRVHLMGLLSDGGVHSHIEHLYALLELCARHGVIRRTYVHAFLDGRDVPPASAEHYIDELEKVLSRYREACHGGAPGTAAGGKGGELTPGGEGTRADADGPRVATLAGRYYAMDRDKRWDRTRKAYDAIVMGEGPRASTAAEALALARARGETDEFVVPTVVAGSDGAYDGVRPGDSIVFFNFRADRARQIARAFVDREFRGFEREGGPPEVEFVGMTLYEEGLPVPYAFGPQFLTGTFGQVIADAGLRQLRIAETEKYAHVTFFFSGREEKPFPGESRRLIPSPKVSTYDRKPEMSAVEVTDAVLEEIRKGIYDVIILNYANPDMVGHTGVLDAAIKAIEAVDECLGRVVGATLESGGALVVCSDHGNAEQMLDYESGEPHTAHTSNPVPCILVDEYIRRQFVSGKLSVTGGVLGNVAPTMLWMLGLGKPEDMECDPLVKVVEA